MRIVSVNITHDSSVCSFVDGKLEFYCKEERLCGKKRSRDPFLALETYRNQNFGKIDHFLYLIPSGDLVEHFFYTKYIKKFFDVELENFSYLNHHNCHASLSFYNSEFSQALVFVIDRMGSVFSHQNEQCAIESESVYIASYPDNIIPIYKSFWILDESKKCEVNKIINDYYQPHNVEIKINNPYSIVKVYESATTLIGQHALENGKTMGLASYGEDLEYPSLFLDGSPIRNYFSEVHTNWNISDASCFYECEDKIEKNITKDNYQFYANKSKHVQIETQKEVLRLIEKYVKKTGIKNVCLVGGYGLNVVANSFYIKNLPDVNFYFEPLSDDSGVSIGACMLKYRQETKDKNICGLKNNFYHYYQNDEEVFGEKKSIDDLIDNLISQKIIAIFEGNPEAGPRALGHRSLLFDPRNKDGKEIVNTLKNREWYRPFAGIILEEHFSNYFETMGLKKSEYMTINFDAKPGTKNYVPSIIHVDNTCRIQTVSKDNPFLFKLLSEFYKRTKCPILLNTSFNLAGQPLVQTKQDAIEFLTKSKDNKFFGGVYFVDDETLLTNESD